MTAATPPQDYAPGSSHHLGGTVMLAGSLFRIEVQTLESGNVTTWLYGPRGAAYFLRPYLERKGDTGLRQVISWKSGAPLRKNGNEIRVHQIGDVLEEVGR